MGIFCLPWSLIKQRSSVGIATAKSPPIVGRGGANFSHKKKKKKEQPSAVEAKKIRDDAPKK